MTTSSNAELIKEKLDIVEFLRGYLNLQPAGKNFKALCPFHREKTPSFMVSPERQSWHCFGCAAGGDIFSFIMRYENLEFGEALRVLAEKAGIELRRVNPAEYKFTGLLYDLNNAAKEFFKKSLQGFLPARKYLKDRGLEEETIDLFELGWTPNEPETLTLNFLKSGYRPEDLIQAGLSFRNDRGKMLDRFRGRIMFPVHNHFGKVVGFTGRIFPEFDNGEIAKYVNSPETPIFFKSKILYGFFESRNFIREKNEAFLVEGQMDFLMSWQAGIKNTIAASGTALTPDHLKVLRRLTDRLILSFDSDEAGKEAAERAIDLAEMDDFEVRVAVFEEFKDPAEAAQQDPQNLIKAIGKAKAATEFYFDKYLPKNFSRRSREDLKNLRIVLGKIKNLASAVEQSFWLKELADKTGLNEKILTEEAEKSVVGASKTKKEEGVARNGAKSERTISRHELIGEELIGAALVANNFQLIEDSVLYLAAASQNIWKILSAGGRASSDPVLDELLNLAILKSRNLPAEEIERLKNELFKEFVKEKRQELTLAVKNAEMKGDGGSLEQLLKELNSLPSARES